MANTMIKEKFSLFGAVKGIGEFLFKNDNYSETENGYCDEEALQEAEEIARNSNVKKIEEAYDKSELYKETEKKESKQNFSSKLRITNSSSGGGGNSSKAGHGFGEQTTRRRTKRYIKVQTSTFLYYKIKIILDKHNKSYYN